MCPTKIKISDEEIYTQVVDYAYDYPNRINRNYGEVSYAQLKSGKIEVNGKKVTTAPLSSVPKAREIAEELKQWIIDKKFYLAEPVAKMPNE